MDTRDGWGKAPLEKAPDAGQEQQQNYWRSELTNPLSTGRAIAVASRLSVARRLVRINTSDLGEPRNEINSAIIWH